MTETKQWMGLHNHDRHFYSPGYGDRCGKCWYCSPETPCYCCLQAEVEALRAQVQADEEAERSLRERYNDLLVDHGKLTAQVQALRAQVQRVRAVADAWEYYASENGNVRTAWAASSVREALDGDGDA